MDAKLIVALDLPDSRGVEPLVKSLPPEVEFYKVGLELFCSDGYNALAPLQRCGKRIFLDLKLHDIPRTVARAVTAAANHDVHMLTIHASGGRDMLRAAAAAARDAGPRAPKILAVTLLTSLNQDDLRDLAIQRDTDEQVIALAELATACGIDGLVCSPREVGSLRRRLGPAALLVTPGIRLPDDSPGDQKRFATPRAAVRDGASHLVVGRPILDSADPAQATRTILADMIR